MVFYINTNDVEFGIKLDEKEVAEFATGAVAMISDGSLTELIKGLTSAFEMKADEQEEEEKSEEPEEEATDEERYIECYTFCDITSNKEKAALVRAWLKKKEIKYVIDSMGIKKYAYKLTPMQLIELQDYLLDNDVTSWEVNI